MSNSIVLTFLTIITIPLEIAECSPIIIVPFKNTEGFSIGVFSEYSSSLSKFTSIMKISPQNISMENATWGDPDREWLTNEYYACQPRNHTIWLSYSDSQQYEFKPPFVILKRCSCWSARFECHPTQTSSKDFEVILHNPAENKHGRITLEEHEACSKCSVRKRGKCEKVGDLWDPTNCTCYQGVSSFDITGNSIE
ncbi:unnamed protein product [Allacma fusca]|uniref:Platelet-derived growth factor (PDGF) family profile domain-containing protein n=1 Tax=Allacma fusca TaxID=39272 RepID=A0A8J2NJB5_9HEXA|nr:unnamed protein product [Allacma fusca]